MSAITQPHEEPLQQRLEAAMAQVNHVLLGKPRQVKLAFTCLIAGDARRPARPNCSRRR